MSNRGYDCGWLETPRLRRRRHGLARVKKLLVTSAVGATVAGCAAVEIFLAGLPQHPLPPLPGTLPPELSALVAAGESGRVPSPQSGSLQPTARQGGQRAESRIEVPLMQTPAGSAYEKTTASPAEMPEPPRLTIPQHNPISRPESPTIARPKPVTTLEPQSIAMPSSTPAEKTEPPRTTALERRSTATWDSSPIARAEPTPTTMPEPRAIATAESTWSARLGPALESPRTNQAAPHLGKAADRAGLLLRDSDVRYLSRAELQTLSADQLHIARNEIFARRGRFFKDDRLRAYFLQFPWYRPHTWEVALGLVEQANIALIQSVEEAKVGSTEAPVAASRGTTGPLPDKTKAENGDPFANFGRRYLTREELQGLSADRLAIVRNQIFARRGRYFKDDWLRAYFSQFPWYRPYAWDIPLSPLEQANVKLVQSVEQTATRPDSRTWLGPPM